MPKTSKQRTGELGENIAVKYLLSKNFRIIFRNYRKKFGEIDIVAQYNGELIFVEVKTRKKVFGNLFGNPEESVNKKKIKKIVKTIQNFLLTFQYPLSKTNWRIDIISIELNWKTRIAEVKHIKNALPV